jgi:hypothetical protein
MWLGVSGAPGLGLGMAGPDGAGWLGTSAGSLTVDIGATGWFAMTVPFSLSVATAQAHYPIPGLMV